MTIDNLKAFGADTELGLARCVGNEGLYFKLIRMILTDGNFSSLGKALEEKDLPRAFECSHALKGTVGNLALDPLYDEICVIVEPLRRNETDFAYAGQYDRIMSQLHRLQELAGS